jgi:hypothetical protein
MRMAIKEGGQIFIGLANLKRDSLTHQGKKDVELSLSAEAVEKGVLSFISSLVFVLIKSPKSYLTNYNL